jgi:hypothetical protein
MPVDQLVCTVEETTSYVPIKRRAFCTGSSSFSHLKPHESESALPLIDTLSFKMLPLMSLHLRIINYALKANESTNKMINPIAFRYYYWSLNEQSALFYLQLQ